jgi:hypothetical protein
MTIELGDKEIEKEYSLTETEIKSIVKDTKSNIEIVRQLNKIYFGEQYSFLSSSLIIVISSSIILGKFTGK